MRIARCRLRWLSTTPSGLLTRILGCPEARMRMRDRREHQEIHTAPGPGYGRLGIAAFALMAVKDRTYVASEAYAPVGEPNRAVAVVYYSRSGHSEAVAREVRAHVQCTDRSHLGRLSSGLLGSGKGRL